MNGWGWLALALGLWSSWQLGMYRLERNQREGDNSEEHF